MKIGFNIGMAAVVVVVLIFLRKRRTPRAWLAAMLTILLAPTALMAMAVVEAGIDTFQIMGLSADVFFVHLPIVLGASAWWLRKAAPRIAWPAGLAAAAIAAVGIDAFWIEPTQLEVTHLEIRSPKLQRPVRVVVLADVQMERFGAYERQVFAAALKEQPELILLAGDYIQAPAAQRMALRREVNAFLRESDFHAPRGVFAVRGNVDKGDYWTALFENLPVRVVQRTESIDLDDDLRLTCLSCKDSFDYRLQLPAPPPQRFHLVLGHAPNFALSVFDADLVIAGHTHGGQIRLPWVGPLTTLGSVPRRSAAGLSDRPSGGLMFVSRGIGMERGDAPRMRFLCRPELAVIDLLPQRRPGKP